MPPPLLTLVALITFSVLVGAPSYAGGDPGHGAINYQHSSELRPGQQALVDDLLDTYGSRGMISRIAENADYAGMALAAYGETTEPSGWWTSPQHTVVLGDYFFGGDVSATVFWNADEIVIAFRGSATPLDWVTNSASGIQLTSTQVNVAGNFANAVVDSYASLGRKITFVGHSLGGRLAMIAAYATGQEAVVFNSAPLTIAESVALNVTGTTSRITSFRTPQDLISSSALSSISGIDYIEPDNEIQVRNFPTEDPLEALGTSLRVLENHDMGLLAAEMQTVQIVDSWME